MVDVPVLVQLRSDRVDLAAIAEDASDLRFFDERGEPMPHEIESWAPAKGGVIWVRVPRIDANTHTFTLRYGESEPGALPLPSTVWAADFVAVYHLSTLTDSTSSDLDAMFGAPAPHVPGLFADAVHFVAGDDALVVEDDPLLDLASAVTVEAWVFVDEAAPTDVHRTVVSKSGNYRLSAVRSDTAHPMFMVEYDGDNDYADSEEPLPEGEWVYLAGTYGSTGDPNDLEIFVDGARLSHDSALEPLAVTVQSLQIGGDPYLGAIDEVRLSNVARTDDWIHVQHLSMLDQLLEYGPAESR
jgi:hypothetical protein